MTTLRLIEQDDTLPAPLTGAELLRQCADLIEPHLATLALDDPFRGALATLALAAPTSRRRR